MSEFECESCGEDIDDCVCFQTKDQSKLGAMLDECQLSSFKAPPPPSSAKAESIYNLANTDAPRENVDSVNTSEPITPAKPCDQEEDNGQSI